jgi:DNA-binding NtrC family response regulator/Tfp pilus assembly protein PilF
MLACAECREKLPLGAEACPNCGRVVEGAAAALAAGIAYFAELRYDAALREFERARQIAPADPDVRRCHAHGLYHAGHAESALARYRELLKAEPESPEVVYNLGQILINQGRLDQARAWFERLSAAPSHFDPDRFYLGLLFGEPAHFQADCNYYLAIICWNRGEIEAAEHYFDRALKLNPSHAQAGHHLGDLHFQARQFDKAIDCYRRFFDLQPAQGAASDAAFEANCNLGVALFEVGRIEEAKDRFKSVLTDRPGHPRAIYHMNRIYELQGLYALERREQAPVHPDTEQATPSFELAGRAMGASADGAPIPIEDPRPIVGKSLAMMRVLRHARLAAASDATVILTGENGVGKELVARAIHANSGRRDRSFAPVNCAAIPETLIESELFGHEQGAFTGAVERKLGRFEAADGGTIFLDEIGELDLNMQVKLLRFLQEREFNRVGGGETISVDVRIIAATNRNLEEQLERGLFRQDLYYRLNVLPIHIPPLRERPEDVPLLVDYFVEKYNTGPVRRESMIGEEDMSVLTAYDWPGNVRELENVIERASVLGAQVIPILQGTAHRRQREQRPAVASVGDGSNDAAAPASAPIVAPPPPAMLEDWNPMSIRELERLHIERMLRHTSGNRGEAARLLGINPTTLWRKMKTYEIS